MKLAIVGNRKFDESKYTYLDFCKELEFLLRNRKNAIDTYDTIVTGNVDGIDAYARQFANEFDFNLEVIKADWKIYGRGAGIKSADAIINSSDKVLAFWDHSSKGTAHSIKVANKQHKLIKVVILESDGYTFSESLVKSAKMDVKTMKKMYKGFTK